MCVQRYLCINQCCNCHDYMNCQSHARLLWPPDFKCNLSHLMPGSHGNGRLVPVAAGCLVAVDQWRWKSINVPAACFLTHMHADHVAGLSDVSAFLK